MPNSKMAGSKYGKTSERCLKDDNAPIDDNSEEFSAIKNSHFEEMLDTLGHFGRFQIRVFVILTLMDLSTNSAGMLFIFSHYVPPWTCLRLAENASLPNDTNRLCSFNGSRCVLFDYDLTNALTSIITEFNLVCELSYIPKLSVSLQMVGVFFGAMASGYLADSIGRKKTLLGFAFFMMVSQFVVGFSDSWLIYSIIRTLTGFFTGGTLNICFTLPIEFVGPKWRTFCACFVLYGLGKALMSLFAYSTRNWRHTAFITASIGIPLLPAIIIWVPESVRWLTMKGRFKEADEIIRWMARTNKTQVPDLNLLRLIAAKDRREQEKSRKHGYLDLFKTRKLAIQTCIIIYCWFSCSAINYGISSMYSTFTGTVFVNAVVSSFVSIPADWSVIFVANRFGRRRSFFFYMLIPITCMVAVVIIGALNKAEDVGILTTMLVILGNCGILSCWTLASIYSAEIYATVIRNLGCGAGSMGARIGGIIAPQIALLGQISYWIVPYVVYAFLAISTTLFVMIWLPETNKKPLKDSLRDAEESPSC
ncbi:organic cation transporter protein-like [Tubulanus polymorphus]|uniref:organic cation transporter protein-like n=1 Tax=Tubulanus polymorphus TaxID=672921 RepID=UPI003DA2E606